MYSDFELVCLIMAVVCIAAFIIRNSLSTKIFLIHRLYITVGAVIIIWMLALIAMKFTDPADTTMLYVWDAVVYIGCAGAPVLGLLIVLTYAKSLEKLPRSYYLLFVVPLFINIMVWTNPLHHLFYRVFSVDVNAVVFGPMVAVSGIYGFIMGVMTNVVIYSFALRHDNKLYMKQAVLFSIGSTVPLVVNFLAMLRVPYFSIVATPLSFIVTIVCHGLAIYHFHLLDIKPVATQRVLDWISDCYLVINEDGLIISYNLPFAHLFGKQYGIDENRYLQDCAAREGVENRTGLYNLISAVESCRKTASNISYEQSIFKETDGETVKLFYMVEITPLFIDGEVHGFVAIFKDVTKIKEGMQKLQDSYTRIMEQERLASLGQMVGGLAHNLKTPIMSISGSAVAVENLVEECTLSMGDPDVTAEDYAEIRQEIAEWLVKIREACAYMSDIISAVKGQATNANVSEGVEFSLSELIRRVSLLLRHELLNSHCGLRVENAFKDEIYLQGDINNMVQVLNNLVSNAIDAQKGRNGDIVIGIDKDEEYLKIQVKDWGSGVAPEIKKRLFKQMITSKGAQGTGLGIYISNAVVKGKFGGFMWLEDNPEGGSIFGISIPLTNVTFRAKG